MRAFLLMLLVEAACAQMPPLLLDHDMLVSLARTREPEVRIGYTKDRVEFRTRRSALVGWVDVLLTARFERHGPNVQLVAQSLRAGPLEQRGKRLEQAREGLKKMVNVKTAALRVEIYRAGELVYSQDLAALPDEEP